MKRLRSNLIVFISLFALTALSGCANSGVFVQEVLDGDTVSTRVLPLSSAKFC